VDSRRAIDSEDEALSATESSPPKTSPRRAMMQIGLRTLLLLTAAVAVWLTHLKNRHDITDLTQKITAMRPLARELFVNDPSQIAVVKQEERWYDQNDWKVYLPAGEYRLCLATQDINNDGLAPINSSVPLAAGTHDLALEQKRTADKAWQTIVTINGEEALRAEEPADWNSGNGSTGGGQFSNSTQRPANEPLVLFRRRFMVPNSSGGSSTPKGPGPGVLVWIEPTSR
jgi:hypothetical protein